VNGAAPTDIPNLLLLSGFPPTGVTVTLGMVEDTANNTQDSAPEVNGYP
jgi:hypothetical protein